LNWLLNSDLLYVFKGINHTESIAIHMKMTVVVFLGNSSSLGKSCKRLVKNTLGINIDFFHITYQQACSHLSDELLADANLFILELFRNYTGGLRVEGIALGEKLASKGKKVLVISPLSLKEHVDNPCYWDVASNINLTQKIVSILNSATEPKSQITRLRDQLGHLLEIPRQHHR